MSRQAEPVARFRQWIIEKLTESSWVVLKGEELEQTAERLGLQPELLREAQALLAERCRREGRQGAKLGVPRAKERRGGRSFVDIVLPKKVHEDWQRYCELRGIAESTLLRSVVHRALSFPPQIEFLCRSGWIYRGEQLKICVDKRGGDERGRYVTSVVSEVTPGAKRALARRARKLGINPSAIVREAILDLLEGLTRELTIIGAVSGMWDDADRYL